MLPSAWDILKDGDLRDLFAEHPDWSDEQILAEMKRIGWWMTVEDVATVRKTL